jgi:YVTN family beta-propeller protein
VGGGVTELNASDCSVVRTIGLGGDLDGISSDGTHVWVANSSDNTVTELNASNGSVVQTIGVGGYPFGVSSDGTHVWVTGLDPL